LTAAAVYTPVGPKTVETTSRSASILPFPMTAASPGPKKTAVVSGRVQWQQMISVGERTIHQLWAGPGDVTTTAAGQAALWHRLSTDGGQSWSRAARVAGLGQNPVPAAVALDAAAPAAPGADRQRQWQ
jgi:hypothetical protein